MSAIWTNRFSVGNRVIDSAHRDILNILFRIAYLIGEKDFAALRETFMLLEESLCTYFEVEEKYAQSINVDFAHHRHTHQRLLNDIKCIRNTLEAKNGMWADGEGEAYTNSWVKNFVQHIKDDGKPMKAVLDTHYYDFQPA